MEAVIFCGIQGSGKSTFFKERFFRTHVLVSLDVLRTRRREQIFLTACLGSRQRFVVDNTNPTQADRAVYIEAAREKKFTVACYYFASSIEDALARNALRSGKAYVPYAAIRKTMDKLEPPSLSEGFDALYQVTIEDGEFVVCERHEAM